MSSQDNDRLHANAERTSSVRNGPVSGETAAEPVRVQEVREGLFPIHEDDRDALAITALELGIACDVDLLEVEWDLGADL
jgi:hypothetical protein